MSLEAGARPAPALRTEPAPAGLGARGGAERECAVLAAHEPWQRPGSFESMRQAAAPGRGPAVAPAGPRSLALAQAAERLIWHGVAGQEARNTSVRHLATRLGYSARALQLAFAQNLGLGVARYVRLVQLHHARDALRGAEVATVSAAATRYGLWHFGRFSVEYRRIYGESPSETLRRARMQRPPGAVLRRAAPLPGPQPTG
jgi:AraC-like DNA-binding protein